MQSTPLKFHGGKHYLARWIHEQAPPSVNDDPENGYTHRNIVFAGGLGELWSWECDGIGEAMNDLNGELTNFWSVLANPVLFNLFVWRANFTPLSEPEWESAYASTPGLDNPVDEALAFFVQFRQSRQGTGESYCTPTTRRRRGMNENVSAWLSAVDSLPEAHDRLIRVEVRSLDFEQFIAEYDHPRAHFYLDPPYLGPERTGGGEYGDFEMSLEDHGRLVRTLRNVQGTFQLSGYHNDLYDEAAEQFGWRCEECWTNNKASSRTQKPRKIECLWMNY